MYVIKYTLYIKYTFIYIYFNFDVKIENKNICNIYNSNTKINMHQSNLDTIIRLESLVVWNENQLYYTSSGWKERPITYEGIIKTVDYKKYNVNVLLINGTYRVVHAKKLVFL